MRALFAVAIFGLWLLLAVAGNRISYFRRGRYWLFAIACMTIEGVLGYFSYEHLLPIFPPDAVGIGGVWNWAGSLVGITLLVAGFMRPLPEPAICHPTFEREG